MKAGTNYPQLFGLLQWIAGLIFLFTAIGVMGSCTGVAPVVTPDGVTTIQATAIAQPTSLTTATLYPVPDPRTAPASPLDYSTRRVSDNGWFLVSYSASTDAIPINQMHQWTLRVETADGKPALDATITVDGDMPEHGHGLPTRPQVTTNLGDGNYLVEGLKFQMGGCWVIDFTITTPERTDTVHFNLKLN